MPLTNTILQVVRDILTVGGIAGIVAITITVTICWRYAVHGAEPIPEVLSHALTVVLGFYFGSVTQRPRRS